MVGLSVSLVLYYGEFAILTQCMNWTHTKHLPLHMRPLRWMFLTYSHQRAVKLVAIDDVIPSLGLRNDESQIGWVFVLLAQMLFDDECKIPY